MTRRVVIPYVPRRQFADFHASAKRFRCVVAHRRAGKTVACINHLIRAAIQCDKPSPRYAYIAPLFNQAKDVAWSYLKSFAAPLLAEPPNETELRVDLVNGARIRLYGADNPDRLRGLYLDGVVLDENADMAPSLWPQIIRPALSDRRGWAVFIGTPKGRNEFHALFERGKADPDWQSIMLRASETGLIAADELASAARDMTPEQYAQEFECSFDAAIVGAYFGRELAQAEREGRIASVNYDPALPVHTAWDLGMGDSTAIWFFQVTAGEIRVIDHYENHGHAIPHYASVIASKGYRAGTDYVPHDAKVRELGSGRTRVETLAACGLSPELVPAHTLDDGINGARLTLKRCWFDAVKCKDGLEALRQYHREYDEKTRAFKNTPRHDWTSHTADAFRYLTMAWKELIAPEPKPEQKTITIGGQSTLSLNELWEAEAERREREAA